MEYLAFRSFTRFAFSARLPQTAPLPMDMLPRKSS